MPLYSEQSEQAVLGSMMTHPESVVDIVLDTLTEHDFFVPSHKIVFEAIRGLFKSKQAIDLITVHSWLKDRHLDKEAGSPGTESTCIAACISYLSVETHIKIVKEKSVLRSLQQACIEIAQEISNGEKEASEVLDGAERRFTAVSLPDNGRQVPFAITAESVLMDALSWSDGPRVLRGLDTGISTLNEMTTGWAPGDFIVVAARPGKGKTALLLLHILTLLKWGIPVQVISLEMSQSQLIIRLAAMHCNLALQHIRHGRMSNDERNNLGKAMDQIKAWPLFIDDNSHQNIDRIRSKIRRAKRNQKIEAVFLDYAGLVDPVDRRQKRIEYMPDVSRAFKGIARELEIPFMVAAQLNRFAADVEPQEQHIADTDALGRDADMVMLLHELPEGTEKQGANIPYNLLLTKQRSGPTGKIPIIYSSWRALFYEEEKKPVTRVSEED